MANLGRKNGRMRRHACSTSNLDVREGTVGFVAPFPVGKPYPNFFKVQRHYRSYLHLPDKQGRLVEWQEAGRLDPAGLLSEGLSPEEVRDYNVWKALFQYDVYLKRDGAQECTIIMDMQGFRLSMLTPTMLRIFSLSYQVVQKHLPDREHVVVAINAPRWWGRIWAFFKPLLAREQQRRLRVSTVDEDPYLTLKELLADEPRCSRPF